jgi:hypothetical protein
MCWQLTSILVTLPLLMNLIAFERRLIKICFHKATSARQVTKHEVNPPPYVCSAYVSEPLVHEVSKLERLLVQRLAAQT